MHPVPVLIIETSATLQHVTRRQLHGRGYVVTVADSYQEGLDLLTHRDALQNFAAVILGFPSHPHPKADELLRLLRRPEYQALAVLIMTHAAGSSLFDWVTRRSSTALLLWEDHADCTDCLGKLMSPTSVRETATACTDGTCVLFVDDSRTVRTAFKRLLSRHGYDVDTASCAAEAMEKARSKTYDIAIIDYFMPGGNGDSLCRQFREDPATVGITTAIITGTYLGEVIQDSLEAGAVECMFKNEANELFLARVAAMSRSVRARKSVAAEHQRLAGILGSVGDGVYGVNRAGQITFVNPAAGNILGFGEEDQVIGRFAHRLFHYAHEDKMPNPAETCLLQRAYHNGDELRAWETVFWHQSGAPVPVECTVYPLHIEGRLEGSVVAFRDATERRILERELLWQANHDPLTKLFNRNSFEKHLDAEISRLKRSEESSALLYIDLDRFKYVNDTAGHAAGDRLLIEIGQQLGSRLRDSDMLARLGGDEFAIIMRNVDKDRVRTTAESFREVLEQYTFVHEGKSYRVYGSVGVALIDKTTPNPGEALANADIACHIAKGKGRNHTHLYDAENDDKMAMNLDLGWSSRLQDALKNNNFVLHFQPILAIDRLGTSPGAAGPWNQVLKTSPQASPHYEVLLRLLNPRGNVDYPGTFLPTAERFGLMPQIDAWVLTHAFEKLAQLNALGGRATFTINISGHTLDADNLAPLVRSLLERYKLDPSTLIFEITETCAIANIDAAKKLINDLRSLGCRFALDDFGSGFSSFTHLKHLPVDFVKIDGQFVQGMGTDATDRAIVTSINEIAHSFGKRTIAEFVESADVLRLLRESGVDYAQGYYIFPPSRDLPGMDTQWPASGSAAGRA